MTTPAIKQLTELYEDYQNKFKAHSKLHWKLMCRFGVHSDPKLKRKPAREVIDSKLDLQEKTAKDEYLEAKQRYVSAFQKEKETYTSKYWWFFHPWNRKHANDWHKGAVSDVRSLLKNHCNLNAIMDVLGGDVNSSTNRYHTVRHFRQKGFECDCDYCALNVYLGNKLYDRFYRGNPKNNACDFLAIKGE